jgi:hypothetical protein
MVHCPCKHTAFLPALFPNFVSRWQRSWWGWRGRWPWWWSNGDLEIIWLLQNREIGKDWAIVRTTAGQSQLLCSTIKQLLWYNDVSIVPFRVVGQCLLLTDLASDNRKDGSQSKESCDPHIFKFSLLVGETEDGNTN